MKTSIIYFSQTGNTRKIAEAMSGRLRGLGHEVHCRSIRHADSSRVAESALIGIGSPCFSSRAPSPVIAHIASLPRLTGVHAFVFATSGAASGRVLTDLAEALRKKGARIHAGFLTRGDIRYPIIDPEIRHPYRPDARDTDRARRFIDSLLERVAHGDHTTVLESSPLAPPDSDGLYGFLGSVLTDERLRLLLPRPLLDPFRCNECAWCVDECPTSSISLSRLPRIDDTCIRCYHCVTGCPHEAYRITDSSGRRFLESLYSGSMLGKFGLKDTEGE